MGGYTTDPMAITTPENAIADTNRRDIGYHYPLDGYEWFWQACGGVYILSVEYSQSGIDLSHTDYGWQDKTLTMDCGESFVISDAFVVENSTSCPPYTETGNPETQLGSCHITIYLSEREEDYGVVLSVEGYTESQAQEYDYGEIYVTQTEGYPSGDPIVHVSGISNDAGCGSEEKPAMERHNASICYNEDYPNHSLCEAADHHPEDTIMLEPGMVHHIWFIHNTNDGQFHTDAYSTFTVTITNP